MSDELRKRDDEMLSAYLDGALSQEQANELKNRLARDTELAERLEAMRSVDKAAVAAFRSVDDRPMPARILDLIGEDEEGRHGDGAETGNVVRLRRPAITRFFQAPVAIAASVALAVGLYVGTVLEEGGASVRKAETIYASRIPEDSRLHVAFDRGPSGESVDLDEGRVAEPVLTFRGADGNYCRQVRITVAANSTDTLACRRGGSWEVELVSFGKTPSGAPDGGYQQASSGGAAAMNAAIGDLMGQEPPLDRSEEAKIIKEGWKGAGSNDDEAE